ncbi:sigma-70 family RNA polymerase sigma factor [Pseudanabaena sp. PCC 6802]|uniref:sigma-70 family RNA polymerase sigma factor n=1 Tax=Pseudanabaena sp. PCC 6802 TaxID=118173 RepID=UPI00034C8F94|nr:sigma-70 family RNA polymerase sigma factor [Pseudanabaena sp. PCC 6802]
MTLSERTDAEVFQALRSGDRHALAILYDRYGELVYRLGLRILCNTQEAEDLTQEVFLALERTTAYNAKRGSMSAFLLTIARTRSIDRLRKAKSQQQFLQKWGRIDTTVSLSTPMDKAAATEISSRVRDALSSLPENQRQILEMAYYDGHSQSEISQNLDIPLGTVKTRSRQGLLKLRHILKDLVD